MNINKKYIKNRLRERSTWLGLIGIFSGMGVAISPEMIHVIITVGTTLAGGTAAVMPDRPDGDNGDKA
ncbi:MAG: hypothetical protein GY862_14240 [Gammaproteobacteria bacterium]|nr:hypothetical protein [Gammaproteobacteria bacterium]